MAGEQECVSTCWSCVSVQGQAETVRHGERRLSEVCCGHAAFLTCHSSKLGRGQRGEYSQ